MQMPTSDNDKLTAIPSDKESNFALKLDNIFERMRAAYEDGDDPHALLDALQLAYESGRTDKLPDWALSSAIRMVASLVKRGITKGKGQSGNTAARRKNIMMHFARYEAVEALIKSGTTQYDAYCKVSDALLDQGESVDCDAVKKSHLKVRMLLADAKTAAQFYRSLPTTRNVYQSSDTLPKVPHEGTE